jgi:hypothetical protein
LTHRESQNDSPSSKTGYFQYHIPIPQGEPINETIILSDISRMSAERQTFLNGSDLPSAALVKTLTVPTGSQGMPAKLEAEGKGTSF